MTIDYDNQYHNQYLFLKNSKTIWFLVREFRNSDGIHDIVLGKADGFGILQKIFDRHFSWPYHQRCFRSLLSRYLRCLRCLSLNKNLEAKTFDLLFSISSIDLSKSINIFCNPNSKDKFNWMGLRKSRLNDWSSVLCKVLKLRYTLIDCHLVTLTLRSKQESPKL